MQTKTDISKEKVKPAHLVDWLLERGVSVVSTDQVAGLLGVERKFVRQYLAPLRQKRSIASPARGLWVPVPPDRRSAGAPEPPAYLDAMMRSMGAEYCVGWLTAAAFHGASHQSPQSFQVATSRHIDSRFVGSTSLNFMERSYVSEPCFKRRTVSSGTVNVALPGVVMLMVAQDQLESGGIDNAATVILELADEHPRVCEEILSVANEFPSSAMRRVGWILDTFESGLDTDGMAALCSGGGEVAFLSVRSPRRGSISKRWNLSINREVVPDV